ncbi:hypothetical protein [Lacinutrix chionoecetis]
MNKIKTDTRKIEAIRKITFAFLILLCGFNAFAQKQGQIFCDGDKNGTYFPLLDSKKYIIWGNTFYVEEIIGTKTKNGKTYKEYSQTWESGDVANLLLTEKNGNILQYIEENEEDKLRLPYDIKVGKSWKTNKGLVAYEITSLKGTLKTPVCNYSNLLVLKSSFQNGEFIFYYQKGYGYIGAAQDGELISFVVPRDPKELIEEYKNKTN